MLQSDIPSLLQSLFNLFQPRHNPPPLNYFYLSASIFYFPRSLISAFCPHSPPPHILGEKSTHSSGAARYLSGNIRFAPVSFQNISGVDAGGNLCCYATSEWSRCEWVLENVQEVFESHVILSLRCAQQNQGNRMHRRTVTSRKIGVGRLENTSTEGPSVFFPTNSYGLTVFFLFFFSAFQHFFFLPATFCKCVARLQRI